MIKVIRSREDLLAEKQRLQNLLAVQKQQIRMDIVGVKEELQPAFTILSVVGKFVSPEKRSNGLLATGSAITIDWLAHKLFKNSLLARMFLPPLIKNFSSHLLYSDAAKGNGVQQMAGKVMQGVKKAISRVAAK